MGALDVDTEVQAVAGDPDRFRATISRDWEIWGPNGGYVAVIALRAASAATDLRRPASFVAHFVGVADFAPVELSVRTVRRTKRVHSLGVSMTQHGRAVLEALVWMVGATDGPTHDAWTPPDVAAPRSLPSMQDRLPADAPGFPFWDNLEVRPCTWIDDWEHRPPGDFHEQGWYRFRPTARFADPVLDAARALLVLDTVFWPAVARGQTAGEDWYAPSLDVSARFHALAPDDEFLLADVHAPASHDGLAGGTGAIWSESRTLVATGGQQMLWRPRHLNPNPGQR